MIYICTTRSKKLRYLCIKIVNCVSSWWLSSLFNHKLLYVGCERIPGFTFAINSLDLPRFSINYLKCIKYKMSRQDWGFFNSGANGINADSFRFLFDDYGDSLDVMFPQFSNHSPTVSYGVSMFLVVFLRFP